MERLSLCLKNLGRHGWRTRIILMISALGAFLAFVSENLVEDVARKQSDMFGRSMIGHFRILDAGIETKNTFGYYGYEPAEMLDAEEVSSVKAFLAGLPRVTGARERILFSGLCYGEGDEERGIQGFAMDMEDFSSDFTDLYYAKGEPLRAGDSEACAASWYEYEEEKSMMIGSRYVFLLPNRQGEFVDRYLEVKAGLDYRSMPKDVMGMPGVYFDLDGYRKAVGYEEETASEIVGFLDDARRMDEALPAIEAFLAAEHPRLKVVPWREYAPIMAEIVMGFDAMMKAVEAILIAICVLLVVKLTTFSIIERYGEIGMMRAMGFGKADIAAQFALEGFLVIAAGAAIGFACGAVLIGVLSRTGIPNSTIFLKYVMGDGFFPRFHYSKIAAVALVFCGVAVLAPLFPSIRGGRVSILSSLEKR